MRGTTCEDVRGKEISEEVVEGGEGDALSGMSMKGRKGKDPVSRRIAERVALSGEGVMASCNLVRMQKIELLIVEVAREYYDGEIATRC